jgi:cysteine synthase A
MLNTMHKNPLPYSNITNSSQAEEQGILTPHSGDTIYEGTSGSTGISLATLARAKGYLAHM